MFVLPMPASWPAKKRAEMAGEPHRSRPDLDNLAKGLLDALYEEDAFIWDARYTKAWGERGAIIVRELAWAP